MQNKIAKLYVTTEIWILLTGIAISLIIIVANYSFIETNIERIVESTEQSLFTYIGNNEVSVDVLKEFDRVYLDEFLSFSAEIRDEKGNVISEYSSGKYCEDKSLFTERHTETLEVNIEEDLYEVDYVIAHNPLDQTLNSTYAVHLIILAFIIIHSFGYMIVSHSLAELSAQKKLEEDRRILTTAIAHDLKTPLAIIKCNSECLYENISEESNAQYYAYIENAVDRMNTLLMELLDYTKLQSETYPIDLKELSLTCIADDILKDCDTLIKGKGLTIEKRYTCSDLVMGDEKLITTAVSNLILNAIEYSSENTKIAICVEQEGKTVMFAVSNSLKEDGCADLSQVWSPFYTTKSNNSNGMGLAVCKRIFELHDSNYSCSEKDGLIIFKFTLRRN